MFLYFQALLNYEEIQENINVSDRYDNDPLHIAAMKGYLPIVRVSSCVVWYHFKRDMFINILYEDIYFLIITNENIIACCEVCS